ncbi:MAG TPA: glycosyltransferase [Chthoniobacteraceae bacterium]|nr:glycosyltransferase [Chthoniobacteraceae bacterium]
MLILTAAYGEGHNTAARGLRDAMQELGGTVELVDLFAQTSTRLYDRTRSFYLDVINHAPWLWSATYRLVDALPFGALAEPLLRTARRRLAALLEKHQPAAVVSVYPMFGYFIDRIYAHRRRAFPFYTVVTDSITINSIWYRCGTDRFFVANEATAAVIRAGGVPSEKIAVKGFPVSPVFSRPRALRPDPDATAPRVLFMINAQKDIAPAIVASLLSNPRIELTVTVGRDDALRRKIEAIAARPIEVHGWTDRMPELLMRSHLLIGKAGGAAVQEAIAARTPMLITSVVPGQEEGNAQLLTEHECGAICETPEKIAATVDALFRDGALLWHRWERAITGLSRPEAAREIAQEILRPMTSTAASSV